MNERVGTPQRMQEGTPKPIQTRRSAARRVSVTIMDEFGRVLASGSEAYLDGTYDSGAILRAGTKAMEALDA